VHANRSKNLTSSDPNINAFILPQAFNTALTVFHPEHSYNPEDKFLGGIGVLRRTYGFRKEPFASEQRLSGMYASILHRTN